MPGLRRAVVSRKGPLRSPRRRIRARLELSACGARTAGAGYCEPCAAIVEAERLAAQPYREEYSTAEYLRNRRRRFELARGRCEVCGEPLDPKHFECHHVVALADGGHSELANLRVTHGRPCHQGLTAAQRRRRSDRRGHRGDTSSAH